MCIFPFENSKTLRKISKNWCWTCKISGTLLKMLAVLYKMMAAPRIMSAATHLMFAKDHRAPLPLYLKKLLSWPPRLWKKKFYFFSETRPFFENFLLKVYFYHWKSKKTFRHANFCLLRCQILPWHAQLWLLHAKFCPQHAQFLPWHGFVTLVCIYEA